MRTFSAPTRLTQKGKRSKTYYSRVYDSSTGRQSWKSTKQKTLRLAKDVVQKWRQREARGEAIDVDITLDQVIQQFVERKESRARSGEWIRVLRSHQNFWRKRLPITQPIRSLTSTDIEDFLRSRQDDGLTPRSLNNVRGLLRMLFEFAKREGWILRSPMANVDRYSEDERAIRALTVDEESRLLDEAGKISEELRLSCLALCRSGFRRSMLKRLEWSDVDFTKAEWRIDGAKMKSKKGFTGRPIELGLFEALKARRHRVALETSTANPEGPIFSPIATADWRTLIANADLADLRPHDFRRTFITRCRDAGVPLETCMFLSDHRDLRTVLKCYSAVRVENARDALRDAFGQGVGEKAAGSV